MAVPKRTRTSASPAGRPGKKAKVEPVGLAKKIAAIKAALMECNSQSVSTRKMLCVGLADCFTDGKDDRHQVQRDVVKWIGQALSTQQAVLQERLAQLQSASDAADRGKEPLDKAKTDAHDKLSGMSGTVGSRKAALKEAEANTKTAEAAKTEAEKAQKQGDKDLAHVEQKNTDLLNARTEAFLLLKDGTALPANLNKLVKQVVKAGEECNFDSAMLTSLPEVLNKTPTERGTFDHMVLEQFEDEYRKAADAFGMAIRSGEPGKEERAAKVTASIVALQAAKDHEAEAKASVGSAQVDRKTAEDEFKAAEAQVRCHESDNKAAHHETQTKEKELMHLEKGPIAFYHDLAEWDGTPPVKKPPQYKTIKGRRYDWQLLHIAEGAAPCDINKDIAEALFKSAMDGPGVTPTEKRTLQYIIKNNKIDEEAKNYLETQMGTSWYQQIDGVTYERNLLTMAAEASQPLSRDVAENLWISAMDSDEVTPIEKASLEYILNVYAFADDARTFLSKKLGKAEVIAE